MTQSLTLSPASTALVLIDLQKGILATPTAPHAAAAVIGRANALARRFRALGAPVVRVRVGWSADLGDLPHQPADLPLGPPPGGFPADWMEAADGLDAADGDLLIVKRHWGAFTGTELDLQLRRRGIGTIVLAGVATGMGVESTARSAWELGYAVVVAEDACSARDATHHAFAIGTILPRLGRVRSSDAILAALA